MQTHHLSGATSLVALQHAEHQPSCASGGAAALITHLCFPHRPPCRPRRYPSSQWRSQYGGAAALIAHADTSVFPTGHRADPDDTYHLSGAPNMVALQHAERQPCRASGPVMAVEEADQFVEHLQQLQLEMQQQVELLGPGSLKALLAES